ncbi:MAG: hypothetical protein GY771_14150 [bacterium]|nr:hypothetical protein [bacterium]
MEKKIVCLTVLFLLVGGLSSVSAGKYGDPIKFDELKDMVEDGQDTASIVEEIRNRGLSGDLDNKQKGELSRAGADSDLLLYLNDPYKYKVKIASENTAEYGRLTIDISGSWAHSDTEETPFELALFVDGDKVESQTEWTRLLQVGSMGGGSLYNADYVTKMTLEPDSFSLGQAETGQREIEIAFVLDDENPSNSRLRSNIIYSTTVTIESSKNSTIELEAYNDSKGGFKLR